MNVFPNPNDGLFSIFINKNGKYLATIYNMLGEKMWSNEISDQYQMDMRNYSKGQYMLEIIDLKNTHQKATKSVTIN